MNNIQIYSNNNILLSERLYFVTLLLFAAGNAMKTKRVAQGGSGQGGRERVTVMATASLSFDFFFFAFFCHFLCFRCVFSSWYCSKQNTGLFFFSRSFWATDLLRAGWNSFLVRDHSDSSLLPDQGLNSALQLHFIYFLYLFTLKAPWEIVFFISVKLYDCGYEWYCKHMYI